MSTCWRFTTLAVYNIVPKFNAAVLQTLKRHGPVSALIQPRFVVRLRCGTVEGGQLRCRGDGA